MWVLRDGISMCINMNLATVEIELDAKLVVELLKKDVLEIYIRHISPM